MQVEYYHIVESASALGYRVVNIMPHGIQLRGLPASARHTAINIVISRSHGAASIVDTLLIFRGPYL